MWKKIVIGVVVLAVIALAVFKIFFPTSTAKKSMEKALEDCTSYHMEGNMDLEIQEETRHFFVTTDYLKEGDDDYFKVSLLDKGISQEQIIVKNKSGVYVLTPSLNAVYHFEGDWPLNSPKPYLYQSMLELAKGKHELTKVEGGYLLKANIADETHPEWKVETVRFDKEWKPSLVTIESEEKETLARLTFTEVQMNVETKAEDFSVENIMKQARENLTSVTSFTQEDLPFYPTNAPVSATLKEEKEVTWSNSKKTMLVYEGVQEFTVVQSLVEPYKELTYQETTGKLLEVGGTFAIYEDNCLLYQYANVQYEIYSNTLTVAELSSIVVGMENVVIK